MPLKRFPRWDTELFHNFLIEREQVPFQFGVNDCSLFSADAILTMTGVDIAVDFRNQYTTELGALKAIKTITGGTTVADAASYCADKFGLPEHEHPRMAKRGDLVIADNAGVLISGCVHLNGRHVVSISAEGVMRIPISQVTRAWSV